MVMLRMMTLVEPLSSTWPWISAPQTPMIVLFEPIFTTPGESFPWTMTTAERVPPTALFSADRLVTVVGAVSPPPVVTPLTEAQPTSGLAAGGVLQPPVPPAAPLAPPRPGLPAAPPALPDIPPAAPAAPPPCPALPLAPAVAPPAPPRPALPPALPPTLLPAMPPP